MRVILDRNTLVSRDLEPRERALVINSNDFSLSKTTLSSFYYQKYTKVSKGFRWNSQSKTFHINTTKRNKGNNSNLYSLKMEDKEESDDKAAARKIPMNNNIMKVLNELFLSFLDSTDSSSHPYHNNTMINTPWRQMNTKCLNFKWKHCCIQYCSFNSLFCSLEWGKYRSLLISPAIVERCPGSTNN